jgi:hypothetical protein
VVAVFLVMGWDRESEGGRVPVPFRCESRLAGTGVGKGREGRNDAKRSVRIGAFEASRNAAEHNSPIVARFPGTRNPTANSKHTTTNAYCLKIYARFTRQELWSVYVPITREHGP